MDKLCKIVLIIVIGFLFACGNPNDLSSIINPVDNKIDVLYKELILPASNVFIDSVRTDNGSNILIGKYNDPLFGETTAIAYTQLDSRNAVFNGRNNVANDYIIDSAYLQLAINYYHSDDSTQTHAFKIYTLADTLFNNVFYLNSNSTPRNNVVIGQIDDYVYSSLKNQIKINLTNEFVLQLLTILENNRTSVINFSIIRNKFKGVAIEPTEGNSGILGINLLSASSKLAIYYKVRNETDQNMVSTKFEFFLGVNSSSYSNVISNRTNTNLNINNTDNQIIKSITTTDANLYLQSLTGIHPIISLQPYKDFLNSIDNLIINRADIEFNITADNSNFKYLQKPLDLRYFFYNGGRNINVTGLITNSIINTLIMTNIAYLSSIANQLRVGMDINKTSYTADVTIFSQFIASGNINVQQLIIIPSDIPSMNRVIFDGSSVKMKIFYTVPK